MFIKKPLLIALGVLILAAVAGVAFFLGKQPSQQNTQSQTIMQATPSSTLLDTPTLSPTPTPMPTNNPSPTSTPKPTNTPTPTPAPTPAVTKVEDSVSPTSSNTCNQKFTFTGKIYTNAAAKVTYKWFSDSGAGGIQTLIFGSAGMQTVTETYSFLQNQNTTSNRWMRIEILTPNSILGNKAEFTLSCPAEMFFRIEN